MKKLYVVDLTEGERAQLLELTRKGKTGARKLRRAQILLAADDGATDAAIAGTLHVARATVERTRRRFVEGGLDWALNERPRPGAKPKLGGKAEAYLVALACSDPPEGRKCWTMQLLADRLVALEQVESISDETVRRTLKKTTLSLGRRSSGASRASAPSTSGGWRTCSTSTPSHPTPSAPASASTSCPTSW